jgi:tetratricopeptide (TPR) repeat protein
MLEARIEAEAATLAFSSTRFEEAVRRGRRAIRIYQTVGERHRAAFCGVRLSIFLRSRSHDLAPAIRELERALPELDRTRDPRTYFGARQALALCYLTAGNVDAAELELPELRALCLAHGSANDRAQVDWLEARVAARRGEWARAEALLRGVRQALADLGSGTDVGLVSLELVETLAARGERQEAARLAEEALVLLGGQQVERDTLVALGLLLESIRERQVAADTVRALVERVRGQLRGPRRR